MKFSSKLYVMAVLGAMLLLFGSPGEAATASAKSAAKAFYKGKVLEFIVPYAPGGGFDAYARILAPALEKIMGVTAIVKNMPGGGSLVATNYLYNGAKPDGLTIMILPAGIPSINQLLKAPGVRYDGLKFNWLTRVATDTPVFVASKASNYKSVKDLHNAKGLRVGTQGKFAISSFRGAISLEALGLTNAKFIAGYEGSSKVALAMLQGEVDCGIESLESNIKYIQTGEYVAMFVLDKARDHDLPNVPTVFEAGLTKEGKKWVDWWVGIEQIGRTIVTSPGVPEGRVEYLEEALATALRDKSVLETAAKRGRSVNTLSSQELKKLIPLSMKMSPKDIEELKSLVGTKYYK